MSSAPHPGIFPGPGVQQVLTHVPVTESDKLAPKITFLQVAFMLANMSSLPTSALVTIILKRF